MRKGASVGSKRACVCGAVCVRGGGNKWVTTNVAPSHRIQYAVRQVYVEPWLGIGCWGAVSFQSM